MSNSANVSALDIVEPKEKIALFNGKDLSGWFSDIPVRDEDPSAPDIVEIVDGVIVAPDKTVGHLVSENAYRNYRLEVDYRLPSEGGGGSILVHVSKLCMLRTKSKNIFPQSLDVKIRHHDAGDIYCIIDSILCDDPERRPLDDRFDLVAGALSSTPEKAMASGRELGLDPSRTYASYKEWRCKKHAAAMVSRRSRSSLRTMCTTMRQRNFCGAASM